MTNIGLFFCIYKFVSNMLLLRVVSMVTVTLCVTQLQLQRVVSRLTRIVSCVVAVCVKYISPLWLAFAD